jgi:pimeloyl-ACP methyl ester carboxylesterase
VDIGGCGVHFIHEPGRGPNPKPLLLVHGWPGSVYEFQQIISMLTDPAAYGGDPRDSFTVVAPSLPGYGFSDDPGGGMSARRMAQVFDELMTGVLGYKRFGAQGGDWGAAIVSSLGYDYADDLIGIHLNLVGVPMPQERRGKDLDESEKRHLAQQEHWRREEMGYRWIHATKPQTLAYALNDSPAGLAAWIAEKFRTWSDCEGDVERRFTKDQLLTNITIYWVT